MKIPELEQCVNHAKAISNMLGRASIDKACTGYSVLRDLKEYLDEKVKEVDAMVDLARHEQLPKLFDAAEGSTSITVDGYRYTISRSWRASIKNRDGAFDWLRQNDRGSLITETVNAQTLAAEAKRMFDTGFELPDHLFNTYIQPNVSRTKA